MKEIKRVDPLSTGKMLGALYFILGLVLILPVGLVSIVPLMLSEGGNNSFGTMGMFFMLGAPVIYGVFAFVSGVISAWLYNVIATYIGGIQIEMGE